MKSIIVFTTTSSKKEAKTIAKKLLDKRLAACIQISKIDSLYNWKNRLYDEKEYKLTIKSLKSNYKKLKKTITLNHSYDTPQIITIKIDKLNKKYLKFIENSMKH